MTTAKMSPQELKAMINKKYGSGTMLVGTEVPEITGVLSSSPKINYLFDGVGIPRKRLIEFWGTKSAGKTTLALDFAAHEIQNQKNAFLEKVGALKKEIEKTKGAKKKTLEEELEELLKEEVLYDENNKPVSDPETGEVITYYVNVKRVAFFDFEYSLVKEWAAKIGVDLRYFDLYRYPSLGVISALDFVIDTISTGLYSFYIIDSIGALGSEEEAEADTVGQAKYGGIARPVNNYLIKMMPIWWKYDIVPIHLNQARESMDMFGGLRTAGGRKLEHIDQLVLRFHHLTYIDKNGIELKGRPPITAGIKSQLIKEKDKIFSPAKKQTTFTITYDGGIDAVADSVDFALASGVNRIRKSGSWFYFLDKDGNDILDEDGKKIGGQGKANVVRYLRENPEFAQRFMDDLNELSKTKEVFALDEK